MAGCEHQNMKSNLKSQAVQGLIFTVHCATGSILFQLLTQLWVDRGNNLELKLNLTICFFLPGVRMKIKFTGVSLFVVTLTNISNIRNGICCTICPPTGEGSPSRAPMLRGQKHLFYSCIINIERRTFIILQREVVSPGS